MNDTPPDVGQPPTLIGCLQNETVSFNTASRELARISPDGILHFSVDASDENAAEFVKCIEQSLKKRLTGVKVQAISASPPESSQLPDQSAIPRRNDRERLFPLELQMAELSYAIEQAGADPLLTEAGELVIKARGLVADYYEQPTALKATD